jgi:diguanylate cyclase (GGDEF)-like protein
VGGDCAERPRSHRRDGRSAFVGGGLKTRDKADDMDEDEPKEPGVTGRRLWRPAASHRYSFELRLGVTFALALVAVGAVQFTLTSRQIRDRILAAEVAERVQDVAVVSGAFAGAAPVAAATPTAVPDAVRRELAVLAARPGIVRVRLVDATGTVIAAGDPRQVGSRADVPARTDAAIATGARFAEPTNHVKDTSVGGRHYEYVLPVDTPTGRLALEVDQRISLVPQLQSDLRRRTLVSLAVGSGLGLPLFYLLGGWSLARRHRRTEHLAQLDALTELGNHRAFREQLAAAAQRQRVQLSIALIDVDNFRMLNELHGHRGGDRLLVALAAELRAGRAGDTAFRIGGDEFAVLMPDTEEGDARSAAEHFLRGVAERLPFTLSIGVAALDDTGSSETSWERADAALYEAKRRGRNQAVAYTESGAEHSTTTPEELRGLRQLLADGAVSAAYQPIWHIDGHSILGYEALARFSPDYGLAGPGPAFEAAERIGRTAELDALCRKAAFGQVGSLPESALLFVNLSPAALGHPSLGDTELLWSVADAGLRPDQIVFEITEQTSVDRALLVAECHRLAGLGFHLALDDVGSGNAGLELLRHLPVYFIKIDREIVVGAASSAAARAILQAICVFAQSTGGYVIAEGIETTEQLDYVKSLPDQLRVAVHGVQGYLLGRPNPVIPPQPTVTFAGES